MGAGGRLTAAPEPQGTFQPRVCLKLRRVLGPEYTVFSYMHILVTNCKN